MPADRLLLVDFGNSRIKWAMASPAVLSDSKGFDWREAPLHTLLDRHWGMLERPDVVLASVVAPRELRMELSSWVERTWRTSIHFLAAGPNASGLICAYNEPAQLGADRWAAMLAARHRYPSGSLVVDCGTATTIDAIAGHHHLGGFILPGIKAMHSALLQRTAIAEPSPPEEQTGWWGRNTASCIRLGAIRALVGLVENAIERLQVEGVCDPTVVFSGGQAGSILPFMQVDYRRHDDLVLEGMMLYYRELFE